jgi:NAD(P)-dependent dehydrogenase (short-subunit alcohol dehydrogenase family)
MSLIKPRTRGKQLVRHRTRLDRETNETLYANAHFIGMPNTSVYAASKAALISLAKTLSSELLSHGIRVNVISPGPTETLLYGRLKVPALQLSEVAANIQAQIPLKRFGTPDEIASAVLYLCSAESGFIVGTELVVDGGMTQL